MTSPAALPYATDEFANPADLKLDFRNPRLSEEGIDNEGDLIAHLVDNADVNELIQSIASSGWLDYEPLIVLKEKNDNVVLEGNRRLAALRILADPGLLSRFRINIPDASGQVLPATVRIRRVPSRSAARDFIGYKHIAGPFKWDALAKAKYAADWLGEGGDIKQIGKRIGDTYNTVTRLINGLRVYDQSLANGFEPEKMTKKSFSFSHLYIGVSRPNVRRYLELPSDNLTNILPPNPVPPDKLDRLQKLMSWLYGQDGEESIIHRQNPDLGRLVDVLGNDNARDLLEARRVLNVAYNVVEDKKLKFSTTLMSALQYAEDSLRLVGHFDGRQNLMDTGSDLYRAARSLYLAMRAATEPEGLRDDTDDD